MGGIHPSAFVHPKAHVEDTCAINADCKIWQFASVTRGTVLEPGCSVAPFALLDGPRIGAGTIISMHTAIGPGFVIGERCFIGPNVVFCNDAWPTADKDGWDAEKLRSGEVVTIRVGDRVSIGAGAVILPGVSIGDGAMIAAGAVIGRNVPAGHLAKRDGSTAPINDAPKRRMKAA
jgi:UDP-3-O-[3-hydroxymyristoyl] glucosamine N-acyltransferase